MREGIGSIFLYNIIITFLLLIFAFLAAIMSYSKAFKVNSIIIDRIEKYEGFNDKSIASINSALQTVGYRINVDGKDCSESRKNGKDAINIGGQYNYNINNNSSTVVISNVSQMKQYYYCVYLFSGQNEIGNQNHYKYGVTSYIYIDIPFFDTVFSLPVYSQTDAMYFYSFK